MGFLLEEYQRECLTTLQTLPSVHAAQIRECEVQKKVFSSLQVSNGFHLYGFDR